MTLYVERMSVRVYIGAGLFSTSLSIQAVRLLDGVDCCVTKTDAAPPPVR